MRYHYPPTRLTADSGRAADLDHLAVLVTTDGEELAVIGTDAGVIAGSRLVADTRGVLPAFQSDEAGPLTLVSERGPGDVEFTPTEVTARDGYAGPVTASAGSRLPLPDASTYAAASVTLGNPPGGEGPRPGFYLEFSDLVSQPGNTEDLDPGFSIDGNQFFFPGDRWCLVLVRTLTVHTTDGPPKMDVHYNGINLPSLHPQTVDEDSYSFYGTFLFAVPPGWGNGSGSDPENFQLQISPLDDDATIDSNGTVEVILL